MSDSLGAWKPRQKKRWHVLIPLLFVYSESILIFVAIFRIMTIEKQIIILYAMNLKLLYLFINYLLIYSENSIHIQNIYFYINHLFAHLVPPISP